MSNIIGTPKNRTSILADMEIIAQTHFGKELDTKFFPFLAEIVRYLPATTFNALSDSDTGVVSFSGPVEYKGEDTEDSVTPLIEDILIVHQNAPIHIPLSILFSSTGGDLDGGLAIMGALQYARHGGRQVHIHVTGSAMSMGHQILQTADLRTMEPNACLMLHEMAWTIGNSTVTEHTLEAAAGLKMLKTFIELWTLRTGKPYEYWAEKIKHKDAYYSAKEALDEGLIDQIIEWKPYKPPLYVPVPAKAKKPRIPKVKKAEVVNVVIPDGTV